jgi:hypothetical protein
MRAVAIAALTASLVACVDSGPGPQGKKIDPKTIRDNLLTAVPDGITHFDVPLGGKVTYVGNKLERPIQAPGQPVKITHYWKVDQAPGPGWRVFAQVRGAPGTADFMNLDATDMQLAHPVERWKAGEVIQDVQEFVLRPDWHSPVATLYVGLIQVGGHDVGDRMAATGPNVVDRAVVAAKLSVDLSKAPPPPGTVYVPKAAGPIAIDGSIMDQGWSNAAVSPEFALAEGSPDTVGKATAKLSWDDNNFYVAVQVVDSDIYSQYKNHDDPLWKQDTIEVFIDADSNRRGYVELQVNPNNATFDSWFATTRAQPGDEKWDSGMVTAVKVRGTADQSGDTDTGWDVEIAIPYAAVKGRDDGMKINIPPQVGDRWRMNVVRVDTKTGSNGQSASSWNRITLSDYHALDRMLTVVFADQNGSITPQPQVQMGSGTGTGSAAGSGTGSAAGTGTGSAAATGTGSAAGTGSGSVRALGHAPGPGTGLGSAVGSGHAPGAANGPAPSLPTANVQAVMPAAGSAAPAR